MTGTVLNVHERGECDRGHPDRGTRPTSEGGLVAVVLVGVRGGGREGLAERTPDRWRVGLLEREPTERGRAPGGRGPGTGRATPGLLTAWGERPQPGPRVRRGRGHGGRWCPLLRRRIRPGMASSGARCRIPGSARAGHGRSGSGSGSCPLRRWPPHGRGAVVRHGRRAGGGRRHRPPHRGPAGRRCRAGCSPLLRRRLRGRAPTLAGRPLARVDGLGPPLDAVGQLLGVGRAVDRGRGDDRPGCEAPGGRRGGDRRRPAPLVPGREPAPGRRPERVVAPVPGGAVLMGRGRVRGDAGRSATGGSGSRVPRAGLGVRPGHPR